MQWWPLLYYASKLLCVTRRLHMHKALLKTCRSKDHAWALQCNVLWSNTLQQLNFTVKISNSREHHNELGSLYPAAQIWVFLDGRFFQAETVLINAKRSIYRLAKQCLWAYWSKWLLYALCIKSIRQACRQVTLKSTQVHFSFRAERCVGLCRTMHN